MIFAAVEDGVDGGAADQVRQAADHAAGALVQVVVEREQGAGPVPVQPQGVFEGGDESAPLLAWSLVP